MRLPPLTEAQGTLAVLGDTCLHVCAGMAGDVLEWAPAPSGRIREDTSHDASESRCDAETERR